MPAICDRQCSRRLKRSTVKSSTMQACSHWPAREHSAVRLRSAQSTEDLKLCTALEPLQVRREWRRRKSHQLGVLLILVAAAAVWLDSSNQWQTGPAVLSATATTPAGAAGVVVGAAVATAPPTQRSTRATDWPLEQLAAPQQQQHTACDLLFMASDNLATYCQCKDVELDQEGPTSDTDDENSSGGGATDQQSSPLPPPSAVRQINQLSCRPQNMSQIIRDLAAVRYNGGDATTTTTTTLGHSYQVDYLSISTNLTTTAPTPSVAASLHNNGDQTNDSTKTATSPPPRPNQLLIDHISLQLSAAAAGPATESQFPASSAAPKPNGPSPSSSSFASQAIEQQMIDFVGLMNETHLQFLSIFLEEDDTRATTDESEPLLSSGRAGSGGAIKFGRLLAKLTGLSRLELSLGLGRRRGEGGAQWWLSLEPELFRQQSRLKWLNLASNTRIKFGSDDHSSHSGGGREGAERKDEAQRAADHNASRKSPFAWSQSLEYLSLESSNLERFPLFSLFSIPFRLAAHNNNNHARAPSQQLSYFGLPNLTSLNLAANKLASFERDLFAWFEDDAASAVGGRQTGVVVACPGGGGHKYDTTTSSRHVFLLPALTQLDLSQNQLSDLTLKAGHYLLCTMPNLNQLYLQRNRIVHLNLNSLLASPFPHLNSIGDDFASTTTKHEGNQQNTDSAPLATRYYSRLEYIDLSHNRLLKVTALHYSINKQQSNSTTTTTTTTSQLRVKSINLSHNYLRRPLTALDHRLLNRVVFKESFELIGLATNNDDGDNSIINSRNDSQASSLSLDQLESSFVLTTTVEGPNGPKATLCDSLSPVVVGGGGKHLQQQQQGSVVRPNGDDYGDLLNEVILNDNGLQSLLVQDFSSPQCKEVQTLRLSGNQIGSIENEALFSLKSLEQLDLSENLLGPQLNETTFSKNVRLRVLNLSGNRLKLLNRNTFLHLLELEELLLEDNELFGVSSELFARNARLQTLDLSRNKLTHLDESIFSHLRQLRVLNLYANQLKRFTHHMFAITSHQPASSSATSKLPPLSSITRSNHPNTNKKNRKEETQQHKTSTSSNTNNNEQQQQAAKLVAKSQKLSKKRRQQRSQAAAADGTINTLVLASNQIDTFQFDQCGAAGQWFAQGIHLLWLNDNRLRELTLAAFKCLHAVRRLHLQSNRIRSIQEAAFSHMSQLEYIDLSKNQLAHIRPGTLAFSSQLRLVDLSENRLVELGLLETFVGQHSSGRDNDHATATDDDLIANTNGPSSIAQIESLNLSDNPGLKIELTDLSEFMRKLMSINLIGLANIEQIRANGSSGDSNNSNRDKAAGRLYVGRLNLSSVHLIDAALFNLLADSSVAIGDKLDLSSIKIPLDGESRSSALRSLIFTSLQNGLLELNLSENHYGNGQLALLFGGGNLTTAQPQITSSPHILLNRLNLASNQLERWPIDSLAARWLAPKLCHLDLARNRMRHFIRDDEHSGGRGAAYAFGQLETLNLSSNSLIGLVENVVQSTAYSSGGGDIIGLKALMPRLKRLDLSHNRLTWIPARFFEGMDELTWLRLDHNQLETVPYVFSSRQLGFELELSFNHKLRAVTSTRADMQPTSDNRQRPPVTSHDDDDDGGDLIIFDNHSNWLAQIRCHPIDEYIELNRHYRNRGDGQTPASMLARMDKFEWSPELSSEAASDGDSNDEASRAASGDERCRRLIKTIGSIRLESVSSSANLNSINMDAGRARSVHLSLRNNALTKVEAAAASDMNNNIVQLDLSANRIQSLVQAATSPGAASSSASFCANLPQLRSLDLSNNQLREIPLNMLLSCERLTYLDLSSNKIGSSSGGSNRGLSTTWDPNKSNGNATTTVARSQAGGVAKSVRNSTPPLLVLKLEHNSLTDLIGIDLNSLKLLRFLDLRFNQFKAVAWQRTVLARRLPLLQVLVTNTGSGGGGGGGGQISVGGAGEPANWKPLLRVNDDSSLLVEWWPSPSTSNLGSSGDISNRSHPTTPPSTSIILTDPNGNQTTIYSENARHHIKFCALRGGQNVSQLCLRSTTNSLVDTLQPAANGGRCFYLRTPANIPSCLTNLHDDDGPATKPIDQQHETLPSTNDTKNHHKLSTGASRSSAKGRSSLVDNDDDDTESDFVLSFIDSLKSYWLRLKEFDVNDWVTSIGNIHSDTIWIKIDGKYPVYTLTVVKVAIVGGSICIIGLLIVIFVLLTNLGGRNHHTTGSKGQQQLSPGSMSESTNVTNTDTDRTITNGSGLSSSKSSNSASSSGKGTSNHNNNKSSTSDDSTMLQMEVSLPTTTATKSAINSSSEVRSKGSSSGREFDDLTQRTIVPRKACGVQQLDVGQLMLQQQQQQPQACSTPSSSLAPSSVETAETLQAVDSIQSGTSSHTLQFQSGPNGASVDQYAPEDRSLESATGYHPYQQQQQQPAAVATVMRMVKSSSANFEPGHGSNSNANNRRASQNSYATMSAQNYSTLRSKIRAIQGQQQQQHRHHQVYPLDAHTIAYNHHQIPNCSYAVYTPDATLPPPPTYIQGASQQMSAAETEVTTMLDPNRSQYNSLLHHDNQHNQDHEHDPITMSLLSINSALSAGQPLSQASSNLYVDHMDPNQSLCRYHRLVGSESNEPISSGVILEQEEDQYHGNEMAQMAADFLPPPPPSSRAIEALENPQHCRLPPNGQSSNPNDFFYTTQR